MKSHKTILTIIYWLLIIFITITAGVGGHYADLLRKQHNTIVTENSIKGE